MVCGWRSELGVQRQGPGDALYNTRGVLRGRVHATTLAITASTTVATRDSYVAVPPTSASVHARPAFSRLKLVNDAAILSVRDAVGATIVICAAGHAVARRASHSLWG